MKERTKNILGYGALLSGAIVLGSCIVAGAYSLCHESMDSMADETRNKKFIQSETRYMEQLQISNNPHDVVAASLFLGFQDSGSQTKKPANKRLAKQLKNAIAQSPDDPDIAWIEAMDCGFLEVACDSENAITRLKRLEPKNLAVYLLAFDRADKAGDKAQQKNELLAMANSGYSDIHYFSTAELYYEALRGWHPPLPLSAADIYGDDIDQKPIADAELRKIVAAGISMAMGLPPINQLSTHCKSGKLPADELLACQKIASLMVRDKTLLMHSIGLRIGAAVFKQEPEATHWRRALRTYFWQLSGDHPNRGKQYSEREYFNVWPNIDELAQQKQRLLHKGIPLTPPDTWMPESEEIRKLLKAPPQQNHN